MFVRIIILTKSIIKIHQHLLNLLTSPSVFPLVIIDFKLSSGKDSFKSVCFINFLH